jgi:peptidoglycan hydrolase-like protein with peptidoglycan-binding domain
LQFGNQGYDVQRLQRALRRASKLHTRIDGSFGRETEDAVRSFQQAAGLDADGVVNTPVWDALPPGDPGADPG